MMARTKRSRRSSAISGPTKDSLGERSSAAARPAPDPIWRKQTAEIRPRESPKFNGCCRIRTHALLPTRQAGPRTGAMWQFHLSKSA